MFSTYRIEQAVATGCGTNPVPQLFIMHPVFKINVISWMKEITKDPQGLIGRETTVVTL